MSKLAFDIWSKATKACEKILQPCDAGSGAAAALGNFAINMVALPVTLPISLPFMATAKIAKSFFKHEHQVVVPMWTEKGSAPTNIIGLKIDDADLQLMVVSDKSGVLRFPRISTSKDGWAIPKSLGIEDGHATWIADVWDEKRNVYVTYHLLMKGNSPKIPWATWKHVSELTDMIPSEALKAINHHPSHFEYWKGTKFDLKF